MAFRESPRFPETIAFGALGGPEYATDIVETFGGQEQRNQGWFAARHRYQLGLVTRSDAETRELFAFFNAVANGRRHGFRFPDFGAGEHTGFLEPLGLGTGSAADYQLVKRYTQGSVSYDRVIAKPVLGTTHIYLNGVETLSFSLDTTTGLVTLSATAAVVITASFIFDVPVRFVEDRMPMQRTEGGWLWESIELVETREIV